MLKNIAFLLLFASGLALNAQKMAISEDNLRRDITMLASDEMKGRGTGTAEEFRAAQYIADQFKEAGLTPKGDNGMWFHHFGFQKSSDPHGGMVDKNAPQVYSQNVVAWLDNGAANTIVIGAHYDHLGLGMDHNSLDANPEGKIHNGADDNASGTAGLLEIAEALKKLETAPRRTIILAFWDGEEKDLLGARHWVASPTVPKDKIKFAFNADMIGRLRKDRIELIGSRTARGLRRWASAQNQDYGLALDFVWDLKEDSDHHCFFNAGIPVLMVHTGLHDQYHRPSDDLETIDIAGIERVSRYLLSMALDVADQDRIVSFRAASRTEAEGNRRGLEMAAPAPPRLGVSWDSQTEPGKYKVVRVENGSAAHRAGVNIGDEILALNDVAPDSDNAMRKMVAASPSAAKLKVQRANGKVEELALSLPGNGTRLGVTWREDEGEPDSLIVVQVVKGSAADEAGIWPGDRIYAVGKEDSVSAASLAKSVADADEEIVLQVERMGRIFEATAKLPPR